MIAHECCLLAVLISSVLACLGLRSSWDSMASSGGAPSSFQQPASAPVNVPYLVECATLGCDRVFPAGRHRHCCSACRRGWGMHHTRRCSTMRNILGRHRHQYAQHAAQQQVQQPPGRDQECMVQPGAPGRDQAHGTCTTSNGRQGRTTGSSWINSVPMPLSTSYDVQDDPGCTGGASSSSQPVTMMHQSLTAMENSAQSGSVLSAATTSPSNVHSGVHSNDQTADGSNSLLVIDVHGSSSEGENDAVAEHSFCLNALD